MGFKVSSMIPMLTLRGLGARKLTCQAGANRGGGSASCSKFGTSLQQRREGEAQPGDVDTGRPASLGENVCYLN